MNSESLQLKGTLLGHNGWVTQIATNPKYPDMILSASRGNFLIFEVICLLLCFSKFILGDSKPSQYMQSFYLN